MSDAPTTEEKAARNLVAGLRFAGPYGRLVELEGQLAAALRDAHARGAAEMRERCAAWLEARAAKLLARDGDSRAIGKDIAETVRHMARAVRLMPPPDAPP